MNAMDLIYGLNNVRDSYVASAEAFRQQKPKRLPKRKLWLIAALIALTLLLVGCAVAYSSGWFQRVFSVRSDAPLSNQQIQCHRNLPSVKTPQSVRDSSHRLYKHEESR